MSVLELLLGRPLRSEEQEREKIGPLQAIPVMGLDALASAAYGPEAALTVLLGLGAASVHWIGPITAVIVVLLLIVSFSYRQTIAAYPGGGGSYTVARTNLGAMAGLLAASALSLDYVLNVAVATSAGVGAIVSAVPVLQSHTLLLCLSILALLVLANLRGVREAGLLFMLPTCAFVGLLGLTLAVGVAKALVAHGRPVPVVAPPPPPPAVEVVSIWLLLRAFASGCTAMTGVEAVSNGVPLFKEPAIPNARRALSAVVLMLAALIAGVAYLCGAYGITATPPGQPGFQSVLSQIIAAVLGRGPVYYATIAAIVAVLCLSANTSFADFPRVCRVLALDEYLPAEFAHQGRRLVYSTGIILLGILAAMLLVGFGGITDRLIPLFAVGAFLAFTLSQVGMVAHWHRAGGGAHARRSMAINGLGAAATGGTLVVIVISKFTEGAWISVLVVPMLMGGFLLIHRGFQWIHAETAASGPLQIRHLTPPLVVIPLKRLDRVAHKAIRLGIAISAEVRVAHVQLDEPETDDVRARWRFDVEEPIARAGYTPPQLVVLRSAYREVFGPLVRYVCQLAREHPDRDIAVIVPELVEPRWYRFLLHGYRPALLKIRLFLRGGPRVLVIDVPWYLRDGRHEARAPAAVTKERKVRL